MEEGKLKELKQFIGTCKSNPSLLHNPSLSFFKTYLLSLGACIPPQPKTEPGDFDDNKSDPPLSAQDGIIESDIELDNADVVEPDNDPPQKMGDPSAEVTEEQRDAAQLAKSKAVDAMSQGNLDEALDQLTEAILLNPQSAILYATRASILMKLKKPNAAIRDADTALKCLSLVSELRSGAVRSLMAAKNNNKMEARMEALERAVEEAREAREADHQLLEANRVTMETRLDAIEKILQQLAATMEASAAPAVGAEIPAKEVQNKKHEEGEVGFRKWRQIEMPIFTGEDPVGWISRIERFFRLQYVREEEKLESILVAMDGEGLEWYQWWESWSPNQSWENFKEAVIQRFQSTNLGNPFQALLALKQEDSVQNYIGQFEKNVGAGRGLDEMFLKEVFLKGLKEEVGSEVRVHEPRTLMDTMVKARQIEEKNSYGKLGQKLQP